MDNPGHDQMPYAGLKALAESAFPKRCNSCGRVFATAQQFISESQALRVGCSGLKQGHDDDDVTIVEVYRNCICGSTLMDVFSNRRDSSELGEQRRELFKTARTYLHGKGLTPEQARLLLMRLLHGEANPEDLDLLSRDRPA